MAAALQENTQGRKDDGEDELENVSTTTLLARMDTCVAGMVKEDGECHHSGLNVLAATRVLVLIM